METPKKQSCLRTPAVFEGQGTSSQPSSTLGRTPPKKRANTTTEDGFLTTPSLKKEPEIDEIIDESHDPDAHEESQGAENDDDGPGEALEDFDWDALIQDHEKSLNELENQEESTREEFEKLMQFFNIWAQAGCDYEGERSSKRLRTRIAHVQMSESNVEAKRQHYTSVVTAFQAALQMLGGA